MQFLKYYFVFMLLASFSACNTTHQNNIFPSEAFDAKRLGKHIEQLASDSFLGRKPFTTGEIRTITYLEEQYKKIGLEPGNANSYFQKVPMISITSVASPQIIVQTKNDHFFLNGPDDYVIWSGINKPMVSLEQDEVIFAGYGIVAPEYNWNDYAGIDVKNKVVLVLANEPGYDGSDSSLFKGLTMTYYARWTYKLEEAARQGAKACLMIHSFKSTGQAFSIIQNGWNATRLRLNEQSGNATQCPISGWISEQAAQKIFGAAEVDSSIIYSAGKRGFHPMQLNVKVSANIRVKTVYNQSNNVISKISGSKWPDEYIIYTAHWDHFGIGRPDEKGDSIYNGAQDNASGVAGLLEIAAAFKSMSKRPKRTIIFLALTAEEQGLWGSDYYVHHPLFPIQKTLANINIDGLNPFEKTVDMTIVGQPQSDLEDLLKDAAAKMGRTVVYDGAPASGYYFRSDQFNFARVGIPAIYAGSGSNVIGKGVEYGKKWKEEYGKNHYHRPSDEYNPATWTMEAAIEDIKLLFMLGKRIASQKTWPKWRKDSEFNSVRDTINLKYENKAL
ncbi:M28 family metallopeptidase [Chitinophagaceae bacterium LB-8]|uniref:M28 family metallopeptidase n=1 Tax=Paraflavisolibacter caeni TaxID=2982496 RepID=A0A9X3BIQ4_9BACT|nr:M28 family metallopeptidase [Paraflavisolibacter caeni]MCU7550298.1 M28 family metallopeptidase [Paraflavisolibacter caeni]